MNAVKPYLPTQTSAIEVRTTDGLTVVARIVREPVGALTRDPGAMGWVLELLPGQRNKPEAIIQMDGRWATHAETEADARDVLNEAAHALMAMLDEQAEARQRFQRRLDKAVGERIPTLPLGEHDPLDDREDKAEQAAHTPVASGRACAVCGERWPCPPAVAEAAKSDTWRGGRP